ncbi:MAG: NAD(P)-dependent oxidoreductase, partial [Sphingopyxis sp.]
MAKITFIGLGVMGSAMARHLSTAGHELTVFNRTRAKAENWVAAHGGTVAASPAAAAEGADAVISCVGTDDDLAGITLGREGVFRTMARGGVFIDHTTVSARIARQLSVEADSRGLLVVDAPVTGGQAGAENGTLTIMCGGKGKAVEAATPLISAYAKRVVHVGGAGAGQTTKMANQIAFA